MQELCDLQSFIEHNLKGVEPCRTCFFPSFPGINSINLDAHKSMDFTGKWIYFHGDSTLRQVYGEVRGIIEEKEVLLPPKNGLKEESLDTRLCHNARQ